jgi:hypothetical protein
MLLDEIKSVLSFAAFKADPDDSAVPWGKRFETRKSLLINVSRGSVSWRSVNKRGRFEEGGVQEGELADAAPQRGDEWRGMVEGGWCSVSVNHRFIISLENNLMRGDNCVSLLRTNPRAVLGPKYDRGKRYAICHHPETTASLLLAVEESLGQSDRRRAQNDQPETRACVLRPVCHAGACHSEHLPGEFRRHSLEFCAHRRMRGVSRRSGAAGWPVA